MSETKLTPKQIDKQLEGTEDIAEIPVQSEEEIEPRDQLINPNRARFDFSRDEDGEIWVRVFDPTTDEEESLRYEDFTDKYGKYGIVRQRLEQLRASEENAPIMDETESGIEYEWDDATLDVYIDDEGRIWAADDKHDYRVLSEEEVATYKASSKKFEWNCEYARGQKEKREQDKRDFGFKFDNDKSTIKFFRNTHLSDMPMVNVTDGEGKIQIITYEQAKAYGAVNPIFLRKLLEAARKYRDMYNSAGQEREEKPQEEPVKKPEPQKEREKTLEEKFQEYPFDLKKLKVTFGDKVVFNDGGVVFELTYDEANVWTKKRPELYEKMMEYYRYEESRRYRDKLQSYPERFRLSGKIAEASRSLFLGKKQEMDNVTEDEQEAFISRVQEVLNGLTKEQRERVKDERFYKLVTTELAGGIMQANKKALRQVMAMNPRMLVRHYAGEEFFQMAIAGRGRLLSEAVSEYRRFEKDLEPMRAATEKTAQEIIDYYGFKTMSQYRVEGLNEVQILDKMREIATVLCKHVYENFHYDYMYMNERNVIPYDYQKDYETYLALVQGRGICTSASYGLAYLLKRLEIPYFNISGRSKDGGHAFLGVAGHIYDPTNDYIAMGVQDYAEHFVINQDRDRSRRDFFENYIEWSENADYYGALDQDQDMQRRNLPTEQVERFLQSHPVWQMDRRQMTGRRPVRVVEGRAA